jgi:hypothetical protein
MNVGLKLALVQKTRKEYICTSCGKPIEQGSKCLKATGLDYDNDFTNWKVHPVKKCYMFYAENIDMIDENDILEVLDDKLGEK